MKLKKLASQPSSRNAEFKMVKVLVAEDHEDLLAMLVQRLKFRGYKVLTADDGYEALNMFNANCDAVIITDGHMPRMSGPDLITKVRQISSAAQIILMTGDVTLQIEEAKRVGKGGADFVILKSENTCRDVEMCLEKITASHSPHS
jgi:CheY-like chemotaxis protein